MIKELLLEANKMIWEECNKTWCLECKYNKILKEPKRHLCYTVEKLTEKYEEQNNESEMN